MSASPLLAVQPPWMPAEIVVQVEALAREFVDASHAMLERLDASSSADAASEVLARAPEVRRLDAYRAIRAQAPDAPWLAHLLLDAWTATDALGLAPHPDWTATEHLEAFRQEFIRQRDGLRATLAPIRRTGKLMLYRGTSSGDDTGRARSWTLRREVAERFRGRVGRQHREGGQVRELSVPASVVHERAVFFTDARTEAELYFADDPRSS